MDGSTKKFVIPMVVWEYVNDKAHKPWQYKATIRALSKYLNSSKFILVENDYAFGSDEIIVIETLDQIALFETLSRNKFARFSFADKYTSLAFRPDLIEVKTHVDYRKSFVSEIPFPLLPDKTYSPDNLSTSTFGRQRKYFATFKGRIYQDNKPGSIRSDLLKYHNGDDIIIAPLPHRYDSYTEHQNKLFEISQNYDYVELMDTKFGLCPGGRQPATYRFVECLRAGVVPIVYDHPNRIILPFQDIIDWSSAALLATPTNIDNILSVARDMSDERYKQIVLNGQLIVKKYFANFEAVASTFLDTYCHYFTAY